MKIKGLFLGVILTCCGLLMICLPKFCVTLIAIIISSAIFINGFYNLFFTYKKCENPYYKKSILIKGVVGLIIGILGLIFPFFLVKTVSAIWKIVNYVVAVVLIFFSVLGFYTNTKVKDNTKEERNAAIKENVLFLLIATILILIASAPNTLFRIIGTVSLITGLIICVIEILKNKKSKELIDSDSDEKKAVEDESDTEEEAETEDKNEE